MGASALRDRPQIMRNRVIVISTSHASLFEETLSCLSRCCEHRHNENARKARSDICQRSRRGSPSRYIRQLAEEGVTQNKKNTGCRAKTYPDVQPSGCPQIQISSTRTLASWKVRIPEVQVFCGTFGAAYEVGINREACISLVAEKK